MTNEPIAPVPSGAIEWTYRVPLMTSRFMLSDLARVIVLSVGIMYAAVALMGFFVEGEFVLLPPQIFLIVGGIMAGLFIIASPLLGNRFTVTFSVGPDGVRYASGAAERRWNRAAVIVGLLAGRPGTAGAGLIASSQEAGGWEWAELHRAIEHPGPRVIVLRSSWRMVPRLHCTPENYDTVRALAAALALVPIGYITWLYAQGIFWTSDDVYWEIFYGFQYESGLLALGLAGLLALLVWCLKLLFGPVRTA